MEGEMYTYSSRPRPVENRLKPGKVLNGRNQQGIGNIMYDRRVVRGNAQRNNTMVNNQDPAGLQRQELMKKRALAQKQAREQYRSLTPEAVEGRKHIDVQTDLYLEELSNIIQSTEINCQTDAFLDRPATPLFIPAKSGKDVATQIEEGELFDFDIEVQPILEVLVGKTMEQSLLEVMEEEELACLRAQQRAYRELRNNELAEVQRLQEQNRLYNEEKERRKLQQKEMLKKQKETAEKIAARAFTQEYLAGLLPAVFTSLKLQGFFSDPVEKDIETNFFPWLSTEININLRKKYVARQVLDGIIYNAIIKRREELEELNANQE